MQYNATLVMTGAIRGTSKENLQQELGLMSPQRRWQYRKFCYFFKNSRNFQNYQTKNSESIPQSRISHDISQSFFFLTFFSSAISEWNKIDNICNFNNISTFKIKPLRFAKHFLNSIFDGNHPKGVKLLMRLRLGLTHLRELQMVFKTSLIYSATANSHDT